MRCVALIFLRDLRFTEGCVTTHQENWAQKAAPRSGMLATLKKIGEFMLDLMQLFILKILIQC